jgi:hypothetical protein
LLEGETQSFERGLDNVVAVVTADDAHVECRPRVVGKRTHPVIVQSTRKRPVIVRSAAEVECDLDQGIVHRNRAFTVSSNGRRLRSPDRSAYGDRHIFDQMMAEVSGGVDPEIEGSIPAQGLEHMVEKGLARPNPWRGIAGHRLQPQMHSHGRLTRPALDDDRIP